MSNPDDFALRFRGIASTSDGDLGRLRERRGKEKPEEILEPSPCGEAGRRRLHPALLSRPRSPVQSPAAPGSPQSIHAVHRACKSDGEQRRSPRPDGPTRPISRGSCAVSAASGIFLHPPHIPDGLEAPFHGAALAKIRETFLRFFESARAPRRRRARRSYRKSDPTLLFTNAGMVPFKRVFLGEEARDYKTATSSQKCMRVSGKHNDLENVGRTPRHHTFFEMLGNFSFGDYFKRRGHRSRLGAASRRSGGSTRRVWWPRSSARTTRPTTSGANGIGLPAEKVMRLDEAENFWSMGDTGPCGPCSEIHVDFGVNPNCTSEVCDPSCDCGRWLEIWNLVFMQYDRDAAGEMTPLPKPSIDTGAGLERLAAVIQGAPSNYDTDLFRGILERAQEIAGVARGENAEKDVSLNVVADHARAVDLPDRRRRAPRQRRARLRPAPHPAPRGAPRRAAGRREALPPPGGRRRDRRDVGRLPRARGAPRLHHGPHPARGGRASSRPCPRGSTLLEERRRGARDRGARRPCRATRSSSSTTPSASPSTSPPTSCAATA